jgi:hypothetical protein
VGWLKDIISLHNLPGKVLLWLYLVAAIPFVVPQKWLETFLVNDFLKTYKTYVGLPFVILTPLILLSFLAWLYGFIKVPLLRRSIKKEAGKILAELDQHEQAVLREFAIQGNTVMMPIDNPVVAGLMRKRILRSVGTIGRISFAGSVFPVEIIPYIKESIILRS